MPIAQTVAILKKKTQFFVLKLCRSIYLAVTHTFIYIRFIYPVYKKYKAVCLYRVLCA